MTPLGFMPRPLFLGHVACKISPHSRAGTARRSRTEPAADGAPAHLRVATGNGVRTRTVELPGDQGHPQELGQPHRTTAVRPAPATTAPRPAGGRALGPGGRPVAVTSRLRGVSGLRDRTLVVQPPSQEVTAAGPRQLLKVPGPKQAANKTTAGSSRHRRRRCRTPSRPPWSGSRVRPGLATRRHPIRNQSSSSVTWP